MEGDAGTSRLNPTGGQERSDQGEDTGGQERSDPGEDIPLATDASDQSDSRSEDLQNLTAEVIPVRRQERFGRGWLVAICACLILLTPSVPVGSFLPLRSHAHTHP